MMGELHRAPVCGRHHGARSNATDHRVRRSRDEDASPTLGRCTPAAWWLTILTIGPLLGSFITEPAAMTICALLLARQFYDLEPSTRLKYATLGLLFVNVSIGGTLTHFAAPPILMVARTWDWDFAFIISHFGWRAVVAILVSNVAYLFSVQTRVDRTGREGGSSRSVRTRDAAAIEPAAAVGVDHGCSYRLHGVDGHDRSLPGFVRWRVPRVPGICQGHLDYQSRIELKGPLLVGFFLAGLVIHGGLQAWWIGPVLSRLAELPLFLAATVLTAFNDNAMITFLATLVPDLSESMKVAVVEGAVTGGGLTVIANAPNPAGQTLLSRFFGRHQPYWAFPGRACANDRCRTSLSSPLMRGGDAVCAPVSVRAPSSQRCRGDRAHQMDAAADWDGGSDWLATHAVGDCRGIRPAALA